MQKKEYVSLEIELIALMAEDCLTTSPGVGGDDGELPPLPFTI